MNGYYGFGLFTVTVISTFILFDKKKMKNNIFLICYFFNFAVPYIFSLMVLFFGVTFNLNINMFLPILLVSLCLPSWFMIRILKKDINFLKIVRVGVDYNEMVYWAIGGVLLMGVLPISDQGLRLCKILTFPFIAQTKLIKAYIGHILLNK